MKTTSNKKGNTATKEDAPVKKSNLELITEYMNGVADTMENNTNNKKGSDDKRTDLETVNNTLNEGVDTMENNTNNKKGSTNNKKGKKVTLSKVISKDTGIACLTHANVGAVSISGLPLNNPDDLESAIMDGCPLDSWMQSAYLSTKTNTINDYRRVVIEYNGFKFSLDDAIHFIAQGSKNVVLATKAFANNIGVETMDHIAFSVTVDTYSKSIDKALACCTIGHDKKTFRDTYTYKDRENTSKTLVVFEDGVYKLNKKYYYKLSSTKNPRPYIAVNTGKMNNFFGDRTISIEQFSRTHLDIENNMMLPTYKFGDNYAVNVLDCSVSLKAEDERGVQCEFVAENMEYCTKSQNTTHGKATEMIWEKYGRVYRLSAHDPILNINYNDLTLAYLDKYYVRVK